MVASRGALAEPPPPPPPPIGQPPGGAYHYSGDGAPIYSAPDLRDLARRGERKRDVGVVLMVAAPVVAALGFGLFIHGIFSNVCVDGATSCSPWSAESIAGTALLGAGTGLLISGLATWAAGVIEVRRARRWTSGFALAPLGERGRLAGATAGVSFAF
jgi:hypothetical protein